MTHLEPGQVITLVSMAVAAVVWLMRLEGKVHKNAASISELRTELTAAEARAEAEARAGRETRETLIRVEERIKHLTDLVERLIPPRQRGRASE